MFDLLAVIGAEAFISFVALGGKGVRWEFACGGEVAERISCFGVLRCASEMLWERYLEENEGRCAYTMM